MRREDTKSENWLAAIGKRLVILIVKYGEGDCREIKSVAKFNTG